jgi:hypothetical protein
MTEWSGPIAPDVELRSLGARTDVRRPYRSLSEWQGRRVILVFVQPDCPHSRKLLPAIAGLTPDPAEDSPAPILVTTGPDPDILRLVKEFGLRCPVLIQDDAEATRLYDVRRTPAGCLLDEQGRLVGDRVNGAIAILKLAGIMPGPGWTRETTRCRTAGDHLADLLAGQESIDLRQIRAELRTLNGKDAPDVSVILCTRDRPRFLSLALECYRRQTYPRRELIVVDNGATFPAGEKAIAAVGGRLISVPADMALGAMLNRGMSQARGRLCQKWDDDDWYAPEFLRMQVAAYLHRTRGTDQPAVVYMNQVPELDLTQWRIRQSWSRAPLGSTLLFERDAWEQHPFRESRRTEDYWFMVENLRSGSLAAPMRAARLHVCVKHEHVEGERTHSYREEAEQHGEQDAASEGSDPARMLPEWALSAYRELSRGFRGLSSVPG